MFLKFISIKIFNGLVLKRWINFVSFSTININALYFMLFYVLKNVLEELMSTISGRVQIHRGCHVGGRRRGERWGGGGGGSWVGFFPEVMLGAKSTYSLYSLFKCKINAKNRKTFFLSRLNNTVWKSESVFTKQIFVEEFSVSASNISTRLADSYLFLAVVILKQHFNFPFPFPVSISRLSAVRIARNKLFSVGRYHTYLDTPCWYDADANKDTISCEKKHPY